jgi:hypothetical protein
MTTQVGIIPECCFCGITKNSVTMYCSICTEILSSLRRPWFETAHQEYLAENETRASLKRRLLEGEK